MFYFWLFFSLALLAVYKLQREWVKTIVMKHQYSLYALRDELREAAMNERCDPRNWLFQYLDSTISKTIRVLRELTVWHAIGLALLHRHDKDVVSLGARLDGALAEPQNAIYREFYEKHLKELLRFSFNRHHMLRKTLNSLAGLVVARALLRASWRRVVRYQTQAPETSTLHHFAVASSTRGNPPSRLR